MNEEIGLPAREANILEREPESLQPHLHSNSALVAQTVQRANHGLLARLFPGELERAVTTHEREQVQLGIEFRRRALKMAVETKLQSIEELCNHTLITGKSEIRRKRHEFFAEQTLKLQATMDACADRFSEEIERRYERLANLRNDTLRTREAARLEKAVEGFYATLDQLSEEFLGILRENGANPRS